MAKELKVMEKRIRINPNDSSRIEYWHDGANKWMDDGGVPGNIDDMDYDDKSKSHVILYMKNGKKFRRDIYDGITSEIKEKAPKREIEEDDYEPQKRKSISFSFGKKKSMDSYSAPTPSSSSSEKSWPWWLYVILSPFILLWWILKALWWVVKFIWRLF